MLNIIYRHENSTRGKRPCDTNAKSIAMSAHMVPRPPRARSETPRIAEIVATSTIVPQPMMMLMVANRLFRLLILKMGHGWGSNILRYRISVPAIVYVIFCLISS